LRNTQKKPAKKKPAKKAAKKPKVCEHCGNIHERPVDYAICAKKNKKKVKA
jgi:hypothetical protein